MARVKRLKGGPVANQKKILKINCEGTQYINFNEQNEFQEDIKGITKEDLEKLKESIRTKGILMPQFLWKYQGKWWLLDGHQRKKAFSELQKEGWYIPRVPIVEIFAKTKQEAKDRVLVFISQHGNVDEKKVQLYIKKYEIKTKNIVIRTSRLKIKTNIDKKIKTEKLKPFKRVHVLLSFHPDILIKIKGFLEEIKKVEGVEFEQGEN